MSEPALRQLGTGDLDEFRRIGHALIDAVADHLEALRGLGAPGDACGPRLLGGRAGA